MATDDERREVAARLRGGYDVVSDAHGRFWLNGTLFGMDITARSEERIRDGLARLADLIEPSEPKVKCVAEVKFDGERLEQLAYDAAVELTGIDRDALLALADEMNRSRSRCDFCIKHGECDWADETICLEKMMDDYASVIREALGEPAS